MLVISDGCIQITTTGLWLFQVTELGSLVWVDKKSEAACFGQKAQTMVKAVENLMTAQVNAREGFHLLVQSR